MIRLNDNLRTFLTERGRNELASHTIIDLDEIIKIVAEYNKSISDDDSPLQIATLLENCDAIYDKPKLGNTEESEIEQIRRRAMERGYQTMVSSLHHQQILADQRRKAIDPDVFANTGHAFWIGVNALLGLFLMFLTGYWLAWFCFDIRTEQTRMIIGLIFSIFGIILEVILLMLYDYKLNKKMSKTNNQLRKHNSKNVYVDRQQQIAEIVAARNVARSEMAELRAKGHSVDKSVEHIDHDNSRSIELISDTVKTKMTIGTGDIKLLRNDDELVVSDNVTTMTNIEMMNVTTDNLPRLRLLRTEPRE